MTARASSWRLSGLSSVGVRVASPPAWRGGDGFLAAASQAGGPGRRGWGSGHQRPGAECGEHADRLVEGGIGGRSLL